MPVVFYDSMREFHDSLPKPGDTNTSRSPSDFNGYQSYQDAYKGLFEGDDDALKASEKMLSELEGDGLELAQAQWDNDRCGFIPCVPSFIAGSPESMRRLTDYPSETTPIKIFTDVCLSGGFSAGDLSRRGTAILALCRKLQVIRPVELYLCASMYGKDSKDGNGHCAIPVIRLDTNPLDLSTASYAMANAGFLRQLCFAWGEDKRGFEGSWAWNKAPTSTRVQRVKALKSEEKDLIIDGAYLDDQLMNNPLNWVNDQIRKYASVIGDAD